MFSYRLWYLVSLTRLCWLHFRENQIVLLHVKIFLWEKYFLAMFGSQEPERGCKKHAIIIFLLAIYFYFLDLCAAKTEKYYQGWYWVKVFTVSGTTERVANGLQQTISSFLSAKYLIVNMMFQLFLCLQDNLFLKPSPTDWTQRQVIGYWVVLSPPLRTVNITLELQISLNLVYWLINFGPPNITFHVQMILNRL